MRKIDSRAGGFFLAIGILGGFAWGVTKGNPILYSLVGTACGATVALLLWLVDRSRA